MKITKITNEEFIRYNANSDDKNQNDCVRRAISLAYNKPYTEVKKELFAFARQIGRPNNVTSTVYKFMDKLGYDNFTKYDIDDRYTVNQFCLDNPSGTYIIDCMSSKSKSDGHLVCVIDGNIYDSWDSSNMNIIGVWTIKSSKKRIQNQDNEDLTILLKKTLLNELSKLPFVSIHDDDFIEPYVKKVDDTTYLVKCFITLTPNELSMAKYLYNHSKLDKKYNVCSLDTKSSDIWYIRSSGYLKFSPFDDFVERVFKRSEFCKNIVSELESLRKSLRKKYEKEIKNSQNVNPNFKGDRSLLAKMPKDSIPYITDILRSKLYGKIWYCLWMEPIPGDEDTDEFVTYAETISELKNIVDKYMKTFERINSLY